MNKVFKKIVDRIEDLKEMLDQDNCIGACEPTDCVRCGIIKAEKIVQEVAEEYDTDINVWNNGWIPCSEQLPEECIEVLVSVREIDDSIYTRTSWVQDGVWVVKKTPLNPTVIAWQPLPNPYKESED